MWKKLFFHYFFFFVHSCWTAWHNVFPSCEYNLITDKSNNVFFFMVIHLLDHFLTYFWKNVNSFQTKAKMIELYTSRFRFRFEYSIRVPLNILNHLTRSPREKYSKKINDSIFSYVNDLRNVIFKSKMYKCR